MSEGAASPDALERLRAAVARIESALARGSSTPDVESDLDDLRERHAALEARYRSLRATAVEAVRRIDLLVG